MPTATDPQGPPPAPVFDHSARNKRFWRIGLLALAVILIIAVVLIWRHHEATEAAAAAARRAAAAGITVTSATAKTGDVNVYLDAIGTVTPVYTSSITSQVNGLVVAVGFKEGQLVRKGEPLIEIDSRP